MKQAQGETTVEKDKLDLLVVVFVKTNFIVTVNYEQKQHYCKYDC